MPHDMHYDLHQLTVLVIENSGFMAKLLKTVLRGLEVTNVVECLDPAKALDYVRDIRPDIVFLDKEMPALDGLAITRQIRTDRDCANPYVPIIMISAHTKQRDVAAARDAGVTEYLAKPVSARAIYDHMVRCIEAPRTFVRSKTFFGPDRRRHRQEIFTGKNRRTRRLKSASTSRTELTSLPPN